MLKQAMVLMFLVVPTGGKPVWTPSDIRYDRRLSDISVTSSHTNLTDDDCVVGAFNNNEPSHVYVGGPCSELDANGEPTDKFRWIEMFTFYANLEDTQGNTADMPAEGGVVHSADGTTHAEVGIGGYNKFEDPDISGARLFASTTSYLAKSTLEFNTVDFVTAETSPGVFETVDNVCVQSCGADSNCNGCPTTKTTANAGDFKYSIFAASYDEAAAPGYTAGATGTGWMKAVEKYGEGNPKQLKGFLNVYQAIDFSNMKSTNLTFTKADGTSVKYKDMSGCSATNLNACTYYTVKSVLVADERDSGFSGLYSFPTTYNRGSWTWNTQTNKAETTPSDTKTVAITMVKPDDAWVTSMGMVAANTKMVFLEYKFNITGIDATLTEGKWMAYDPTVQNAKGANAAKTLAAQNSGSGSGGGGASAGSNKTGTTNGCTSRNFFVIQLALSMVICFLVLS